MVSNSVRCSLKSLVLLSSGCYVALCITWIWTRLFRRSFLHLAKGKWIGLPKRGFAEILSVCPTHVQTFGTCWLPDMDPFEPTLYLVLFTWIWTNNLHFISWSFGPFYFIIIDFYLFISPLLWVNSFLSLIGIVEKNTKRKEQKKGKRFL